MIILYHTLMFQLTSDQVFLLRPPVKEGSNSDQQQVLDYEDREHSGKQVDNNDVKGNARSCLADSKCVTAKLLREAIQTNQ